MGLRQLIVLAIFFGAVRHLPLIGNPAFSSALPVP